MELKKIEQYEIKETFEKGNAAIVLGECLNCNTEKLTNKRYCCARVHVFDNSTYGHIVLAETDDYVEAVKVYAEYIVELAQKTMTNETAQNLAAQFK